MLNKYINKLKSRIFKDFTLNIIATLLLTLATQILAYPYLSRFLSSEEYGLMLTIMGVVNVIGVSLGNPLNNTRLLLQSEYEEKHLNGDYNLMFCFIFIVNIIAVPTLTSIILKDFNFTVVGCTLISSLLLFRAYYSVSYRIVINYKKTLYVSVFGFIGYILGIIITYITQIWVFTFILGELFACIYIFFTAKVLHDRFKCTPLFKKTIKKYLYIFSAAVLSTLITYMDRFYIYPVLGAEQVAIYNVASFLGKTVGIVMIPITGVLLTYYAKETRLTIKQFYARVGSFTIVTFFFYIITILVGIPIIKLLYPTLASSALPYFYIANLVAAVFILGNTIQPTLLRFCNAMWQPIIQGVYFLLYILLGFLGMSKYGLMGFCYSILIVNFLKIILMLVITTFSLKKHQKKGDGNFVSN
ncbi:hypothetical protein QT711_12495 [Sporosarcina saromensis]|uniref:Membrane protein involved in the export of O-antigen and teichoic acid n=1 Tax=Sporosarcina saromensis TaxID=359365 RepID=A0ABU4GCF7_9BACL|nr:hypothetical protein [Sporosarcina saromensis]MDW0114008.1 hypothetical protein [Sporosarcina saromensis]